MFCWGGGSLIRTVAPSSPGPVRPAILKTAWQKLNPATASAEAAAVDRGDGPGQTQILLRQDRDRLSRPATS